MKEEVTDLELQDLKYFKNKMLLNGDKLMAIKDFTVIEETITIKGNWFRKEKTVVKKYLTSLDILIYSPRYDKAGYMANENAMLFIHFYSLSGLRQCWKDFNKQLNMFGFELKRIEEVKS
jgi:hypothetical protein